MTNGWYSIETPMLRSAALATRMGCGCELVPEKHATSIGRVGARGAEPEQRT